MKLSHIAAWLAALLFSLALVTQSKAADKGDLYFGYSRVGANLYAANAGGMNGWQAAAHIKPFPFLGFEGDVSHYGQSSSGSSLHATLVMFGPRVTFHALGFSVFAHGLGGIVHQSATVLTSPPPGYNAASYALGGGGDIPVFRGLKFRVTGDYLGNSKTPTGAYYSGDAPSHYRIGAGVAYHF